MNTHDAIICDSPELMNHVSDLVAGLRGVRGYRFACRCCTLGLGGNREGLPIQARALLQRTRSRDWDKAKKMSLPRKTNLRIISNGASLLGNSFESPYLPATIQMNEALEGKIV